MTNERYRLLNEDPNGELTPEEIAAGWHWCDEWDDMLVGPDMGELDACTCDLPIDGRDARQRVRDAISDDRRHEHLGPLGLDSSNK